MALGFKRVSIAGPYVHACMYVVCIMLLYACMYVVCIMLLYACTYDTCTLCALLILNCIVMGGEQ